MAIKTNAPSITKMQFKDKKNISLVIILVVLPFSYLANVLLSICQHGSSFVKIAKRNEAKIFQIVRRHARKSTVRQQHNILKYYLNIYLFLLTCHICFFPLTISSTLESS